MSSCDQNVPAVPKVYCGRWVVWDFEGTRIIGSGRTLAEAMQVANESGCRTPRYEKIPPARVRILRSNRLATVARAFCLDLVITAAAGCNSESASLNTVFGSTQVLDAVKEAERVEAFRLAPQSFNKASLAEYDVVADPVPVSEADADELAAILTDPATYEFDMAKGCDPEYGVGVRFIAGAEEVTVLFCFECDILTVYCGDEAVGGEDFDRAHDRLVALVQRVFPEDEQLREL